MTFASYLLLGLVAVLVVYDWASLRGKNRRAIWLEVAVFLAGAFFIAVPDHATRLAHFVGIGRGSTSCSTRSSSGSCASRSWREDDACRTRSA